MRGLVSGFVIFVFILPSLLLGEVSEKVTHEDDWFGSLPAIYTGKPGSSIQSIGLRGIVHLQYADVDASQGNADEFEFRRFRFGLESRFMDHFSFRGTVNFDPKGDQFYKSLSQVLLGFSPYGNERADFERFRISVGKMKPRFSGEHGISPKRLKTFERSLLANQLAPSKTTGVLMGGMMGDYDYTLSALAGEASPEFSSFDDGALIMIQLGYKPTLSWQMGLDYLEVVGEQEITSNIRRTVSLSASYNDRYTQGNLAFLGDLLFGVGNHEQPDVFGLVLLSSYKFDARWELVGRYQFASSNDEGGLRLRRRYERLVVGEPDDQRGDRYHAAYLGVNYRLYNDQLRLMVGVEYAQMQGDRNGGDFDGLTWLMGLRTWF